MADALESNEVIDRFVKSWRDISSVYEKLALEVREQCEDGLLTVKCIISHRAKSSKSLKASIQRRQRARINESKGPYQTEDQIKEDMVDLAGVRIALYFPDDSALVEKFIYSEFDEAQPAVVWGVDQSGDVVTKSVGRRFIGYRATHFRVRLKERYGHRRRKEELMGRTVEIQVTSVVMHAWADVHHDLIYKPYSGELSEDEKRILELINGLAHAGEVALQQLQALLTRRINQLDRKFEDQYELATWLKSHVATRFPDSFKNHPPRMELSKLLLHVLRMLELDTPRRFQECLETPQNMPSSALAPPTSTTVLVLQRMNPLLHEWTGLHAVDLTCWALLQICAWKTQTEREKSFEDARRKAFIMINSQNMALSLGCDRRAFGNRIHTSRASARLSDWILPLLLPRGSLPVTTGLVIDEVDNLWQAYLSDLRTLEVASTDIFSAPYDSRLLWLLSCALSGLGVVALPHSVKIPNDPSEAFMWPGILGWPSKELEIMHGRASSLHSGWPSKEPEIMRIGASSPNSDWLEPGSYFTKHTGSSFHRSHSERHAPAPNITIYNVRPTGAVTVIPQNDALDYIFVLVSNGTWLNISTKSLTRESSWNYWRVSFKKIKRGDQWARLTKPIPDPKRLSIYEGDSEDSLDNPDIEVWWEKYGKRGPKTKSFRGQQPRNGERREGKSDLNPLQVAALGTERERERELQMLPPKQRWEIRRVQNEAAKWDMVNPQLKPPPMKRSNQQERGNARAESSLLELEAEALQQEWADHKVKEQELYAKERLEREMRQGKMRGIKFIRERERTEKERGERALIEEDYKKELLKEFKERELRDRELREWELSVGVNREKDIREREMESHIRKKKLSGMEISDRTPQGKNITDRNITEWEHKARENMERGVRDRRLREQEPVHKGT